MIKLIIKRLLILFQKGLRFIRKCIIYILGWVCGGLRCWVSSLNPGSVINEIAWMIKYWGEWVNKCPDRLKWNSSWRWWLSIRVLWLMIAGWWSRSPWSPDPGRQSNLVTNLRDFFTFESSVHRETNVLTEYEMWNWREEKRLIDLTGIKQWN